VAAAALAGDGHPETSRFGHPPHCTGAGVCSAFKLYPKRTVLGLSLFIGQAFLDNAVFFTQALVLSTFFKVPDDQTVGRRPMITMSYVASGCC
jgi:hypothetical protein